MKTANDNINKKTEIEYGSHTLTPELINVNHWEGGSNVRDYLTINDAPNDITKIYIDISNNARTYPDDIVIDTECGMVVVQLAAGRLSGAKQDAIIEMIKNLLD